MSKTVHLPSWLSQAEATPKKEPRLFLTESEVRSCARFKHASAEDVEQIITSLHQLALVAYEAYSQAERAKAVEAPPDEWREIADGQEEKPLRLPQSLKAA